MQQLQSAEKRARLPNTNDLASSPSPAFQATPSPNSTAAGEVAAAEAAAQESVEQAADKTPTAQHTSEATTALLEQLPADMSQPDRLASLCQLLCAAELKDLSAGSPSVPLDPAVAKVVENVLETFVHTVQSAAADGTLQVHCKLKDCLTDHAYIRPGQMKMRTSAVTPAHSTTNWAYHAKHTC